MNRTLVLAVLALILLAVGALLLGRSAAPLTQGAPAPSEAAPAPAPAPATSGEEAGGATNAFIVCPGNPRCPKDGQAK